MKTMLIFLMLTISCLAIQAIADKSDKEDYSEKIIDKIIIDDVVFEVIEKPAIVYAGKLEYATNNTDEADIGRLLEIIQKDNLLDKVNGALYNVLDSNISKYNVAISIDYWKKDIPKGFMFARETNTEDQPERIDIFKVPKSTYIRVKCDEKSAKLLGKEKCDPWELFGVITSRVMVQNEYTYAVNGAQEMEYYSEESGYTGGYAYVPVERKGQDKLIGGIKECHQFMGEEGNFLLPYAPVFLRLLESMNAPEYMDYSFVMSISGATTRLSWLEGWAQYKDEPNQSELFINGDRLIEVRKGFEGAGVDAKVYLNEAKKDWWKDNYSGDVTWVNGDKAKTDIIASIDKGIPVLAHGIKSPTCLIIGYENNGEKLHILHNYISDEEKKGETKYTTSNNNWQNDFTFYCIVNSFNPRKVDRKLLSEIMENVIYLAKSEKYQNASVGLKSYESLAEHLVWDKGFEPLTFGEENKSDDYTGELSWQYERPDGYYREDGARNLGDRFWAGYCDYLCMLNGFGNLHYFLMANKDVVPEWSDDIVNAADDAMRIADYTGELWKYVTPDDDGVRKFKEADTRSIFAAHMIRSKIHHQRIVETFEKILK